MVKCDFRGPGPYLTYSLQMVLKKLITPVSSLNPSPNFCHKYQPNTLFGQQHPFLPKPVVPQPPISTTPTTLISTALSHPCTTCAIPHAQYLHSLSNGQEKSPKSHCRSSSWMKGKYSHWHFCLHLPVNFWGGCGDVLYSTISNHLYCQGCLTFLFHIQIISGSFMVARRALDRSDMMHDAWCLMSLTSWIQRYYIWPVYWGQSNCTLL